MSAEESVNGYSDAISYFRPRQGQISLRKRPRSAAGEPLRSGSLASAFSGHVTRVVYVPISPPWTPVAATLAGLGTVVKYAVLSKHNLQGRHTIID